MSYKRITKPIARKFYNNGYTVLILPCKCGLENQMWVQPFHANIKDSTEDANKFDRLVREFEHYNCNAELGYYAHYYVSEEDYDDFAKKDCNKCWLAYSSYCPVCTGENVNCNISEGLKDVEGRHI